MSEDRSQAVAEYIAAAVSEITIPATLRDDFLSKFPNPTTSELYAGYEIAHSLVKADDTDRIDDVFDVLIADEETTRLRQVASYLTPVPARYFMSAKSCASMLRRAEARGKKIPDVLRRAMEATAARG